MNFTLSIQILLGQQERCTYPTADPTDIFVCKCSSKNLFKIHLHSDSLSHTLSLSSISLSFSRVFFFSTLSLTANRIILRTLKTTVLCARLLGRLTMPSTALTCMASDGMAWHGIKPLQCKSMQCMHHIHTYTYTISPEKRTYGMRVSK